MGERRAFRHVPSYPLFGILNPWGEFWTHETFTSEIAAQRHIDAYWPAPDDRKGFIVVPVRVVIEDGRPLSLARPAPGETGPAEGGAHG